MPRDSTPRFVGPSVRPSVHPSVCPSHFTFPVFAVFGLTSCPNDQAPSNTGPAQPRATGVAVYTALLKDFANWDQSGISRFIRSGAVLINLDSIKPIQVSLHTLLRIDKEKLMILAFITYNFLETIWMVIKYFNLFSIISTQCHLSQMSGTKEDNTSKEAESI